MSCKVKDFLKGLAFVAGFLIVGSGLFEAVVLRLLGLVGW